MEFFVKTAAPAKQRTACGVVGIFAGRNASGAAREIDAATDKLIGKILRQGDFSGKLGETLLLTHTAGLPSERLLLLGCGERKSFTRKQYRAALAAAGDILSRTGARDAVCYLAANEIAGSSPYHLARDGVEVVRHSHYRWTEMKSGKKPRPPALKRFGFRAAGRGDAAEARRGIRDGQAIAAGVELTRDLGNLPANICTPTRLARAARELAKGRKKITVRILREPDIRRLKMGAMLAVTRGSRQPAQLIVLQYKGAPASRKPIVLVGKGITFDSGGISLKPPQGMDEMKFDMSGAGSVLGTFRAVSELELPLNLVGVIPACENMPDGIATRPGDIVASMSGKTIEIINTDAEGRLILCDALTYARRFKPDTVIDVATLTGACVIALGAHFTGLMSNDDKLAEELLTAGRDADDPAWHLPVAEEYREQLKSNFADFANVGGREGGAITAACFLSNFADGLRWAHLDIAGTAWKSGKQKGSTGRPVPLLVQYLLSRV